MRLHIMLRAAVLVAVVNTGTGACVPSATNHCLTVDPYASETGYYKVDGKAGVLPDITAKVGETHIFDQTDPSNWYHAIGFAYYPDGAHGETWGGAERDEVEAAGELLYKIDTTIGDTETLQPACADQGATGLDCYEPEFFYPRADWQGYGAAPPVSLRVLSQSRVGVQEGVSRRAHHHPEHARHLARRRDLLLLPHPLQDERQDHPAEC